MNAPAAKLSTWQEAWLGSHRDPYLFATGVLGFLPYGAPNPNGQHQLEQWQEAFLHGFFIGPNGEPTNEPRHSVRAGHSVGKGVVISILALWFVLTHYDAKAVLTANSQNQLRDNSWPELRKWYGKLPAELRDQIQIDEERMYVKAQPEMGFVVRRTASKSNPEALQGIHAKHILFLIDEASGIPDIVFEIAQSSMSTKGAMAAMFSNPTRTVGYFYQTHHRLRSLWRCWHINCETVPRATSHIADIIASYGKDSNKYRVRVLGEFPTKDDDTVIPLDWVEAAKGRDVKPVAVWPVWGLDISRFGNDRTALVKRQGNILLEPPVVMQNMNTAQIAGRIINEYNKTPSHLKPKEICVDVIGWGAGVVDMLDQPGSPFRGKVNGVNVAENDATDTKYHRQRDALWFAAREWFENKACSIPKEGCEDLISELTTPTYDFTASGQTIVCSKKDMKRDLGFSPDLADAFILTFAAGVYQREAEGHRNWTPHLGPRDPWGS